jgi:hypothetical protein
MDALSAGRRGLIAAALLAGAAAAQSPAPRECHYSYTIWNARARRSLGRRAVAKPYSELTAEEKGPLGCTPCEEDQVEVRLSDGLRFRACRVVAARVRAALEASLADGQRLVGVVGYRPQVSKGAADAQGNRTLLSNHSFGVAFDLNEDFNGLYDRCPTWGPGCVLIKDGPYRPGSELSLTEASPAVRRMKEAGFDWGGLLPGKQKDFMHFSPNGY